MNADELRQERIERIESVVNGKEPDRVPIYASTLLWHGTYCGYTAEEILFDYEKAIHAIAKTASDFDFDYFRPVGGLEGIIFTIGFIKNSPEIGKSSRFIFGEMHRTLRDIYTKWPGIELEKNDHPQFTGKEVMSRNEYEFLSEDPVGFINRVIFRRICENLKEPGSPGYNSTLLNLGYVISKYMVFLKEIRNELEKNGYPSIPVSWSYAPLDLLGDFLRGIKEVIIDLYEIPEKVGEALESLTPVMVETASISRNISPEVKKEMESDTTFCFIPLHLNEYLNPGLFRDFYWPYLLKIINEVVKMGQYPFILFEGRHEHHLETLLEAPKKRIIGVFEKTDPRKVREISGDHVILVSGPPNSLLIGGTPHKIDIFMKNLIEDCKEGGMMIYPGVDGGISRDAKPENVKAVIDAVKKYGVY